MNDAPDREAVLEELRRNGLGDLWYPGEPGCAGAAIGFGGAPSPCQRDVVAAAPKRYRYPRPVTVRLLLCERHARLEAAEPLTADDLAELRCRRDRAAYWRRFRERRRVIGSDG